MASKIKTITYSAVFAVLTSVLVLEYLNNQKPTDPDTGLNIEQLVIKYGYSIETHEVTTEDDYVVTLHRIPNKFSTKQPVLLMHGFMLSGIDFINLGPNKGLALLLADQGYDVWLGNARGSTWSRKHKTLDPNKDRNYWNYSLQEIGFYDVAAFIDYILKVTKKKSLHYIGFSQGTSVFFILMAEKPQYNDKIKLMTAMAPAVFMENPESPLMKTAIFFRRVIEVLIEIFNIREFLSHDSVLSVYFKQVCNENSMFVNLCLHQFFNVHGYNPEGANKTRLAVIYSNMPAGVSTKQMMHIVQLAESGQFRKYDLGVEGNLKNYGQKEPPSYDLSKVTSPVALYYAKNDWTVNVKNIKKLEKYLPNVVKSYLVPSEKFNHDDFAHCDEAPDAVYRSIIKEILNY